jgi:hypothetical protein
VTKQLGGTLSVDPQALVRELTTLDQRSWFDAMGDPKATAEKVLALAHAYEHATEWHTIHPTLNAA